MKRFFLIFLFVITIGFAFHQTILHFSLQYYLAHTAKRAGYTLTYREIRASPNELILISPEILLENDRGRFKADALHIGYSIHPFSRTIDLTIQMVEPDIVVNSGSVEIESLLQKFDQSSPFIKINGTLKNEHGFLTLNEGDQSHRFKFSLEHSWGKTQKMHCQINDEENHHLEFCQSCHGSSLHVSHIDARFISHFFHTLFPQFKEWSIHQGAVQGDLSFDYDGKTFQNGSGSLNIHDLIIKHKQKGFEAFFKQVVINGEPNDHSLITIEFDHGKLLYGLDFSYGQMKDLKGTIAIDPSNALKVRSEGIWFSENKSSYASLMAEIDNFIPSKASVQLYLDHFEKGEVPTKIELTALELDSEFPFIEMNCLNIRKREFSFAQKFLEHIYPELNPIIYTSGTLSADFKVALNKQSAPFSLGLLSAKNINLENFAITIKNLDLNLAADKVKGNFSFDLGSENPKESISAALKINNGEIALSKNIISPELSFNEALKHLNLDFWHFTHIQTELVIDKGEIKGSSASVQLAGLKGKAEWIGGTNKELMNLSLSGKIEDLKPFVGERFQKGISASLKDDDIYLNAKIKRIPHGIDVLGKIWTKSVKSEEGSPLDFGFKIERSNEHILTSFSEITTLSPLSLTPLNHIHSQHLQHRIGYAGFTINEGWFHVYQLPLIKFVSPFLFPDNELKISGLCNIEGKFDMLGISVQYSGENLHLENEEFSIDVPHVKNDPETIAYHHLYLSSGEHYGFIPVKLGSYFDKGTGLLFSDMKALVSFEGQKVHVDQVEAFTNGIFCKGSLDIDYSSPEKGVYAVDIYADTLEGNFTQAQHILSHLDKPIFATKIPLEGKLDFGPKGAHLLFNVQPKDTIIHALFDCSLTSGKMACPNANMDFQDISFNFIYDHQKNSLEISDLQGIMFLGKPSEAQEFSFNATQLLFENFDKNICHFDFHLMEETSEFMRIAGHTSESSLSPSGMDFHFDLDRTHLNHIHPKQFELTLTDWSNVDHLLMQSDIRLSALLHNLQKISQSGLLFISKALLNDLNQFSNLGGELSLELSFEGNQGTFGFNLLGHDLMVENSHFKDFLLSGYKRDNRWWIEQLQCDQISISAELLKEEDLWKVDFLGLRYADFLLLGLSGNYRYGEPSIHAQVNLLELDIAKMTPWGNLKDFFDEYSPAGFLKGSGDITLTKDATNKWNIETQLNTSLKRGYINGLNLADSHNIVFTLNSEKGWKLENFSSSIRNEFLPGSAHFTLGELAYDSDAETFSISHFNFNISSEQLPWVSQIIHTEIPDILDSKLATIMAELKEQGQVKGEFQLTPINDGYKFHLALEDDVYNYGGEKHQIKGLTLTTDQEETLVNALYTYQKQPLFISARFHSDHPDEGEIIVLDQNIKNEEISPLEIFWKNDSEAGLVLKKITGNLSGLKVNLIENSENPTNPYAFHLTGSIDINGLNARPLLSPLLTEAVEALSLGNGYQFQGAFEWTKDVNAEGERDVRFFGMLVGNEIELKGHRFRQLSSQIIIEPTFFQLLDLNISDMAGTMHINNIRAEKYEDNTWKMSIPLISVYDLRPSLLKEIIQPVSSPRKPLIVKNLFLQDVYGTLGDANSFKGHGTLLFNNPQKKNLQNTIFAIPAEILTRIGLNLSVLTPVTGTIHFEMDQGKFYLTKFKDVYSDGKISKFYLPSSGVPSTMDFDGNLDVQLRFKQSTILLKLAEMFTINIHGTLKKPKYSLQRQKYFIKQEEVFTSTDDTTEIAGTK